MKNVSLILYTILLSILHSATDAEVEAINSNEAIVIARYMKNFNEDFATRTKVNIIDVPEINDFCCHNRGPRYKLPRSGTCSLARLEQISNYLYDDIEADTILSNGLIQLRDEYLTCLDGSPSKKNKAKKQLGKDLQEFGRTNINSLGRIIKQCKKRIARHEKVKTSIDELAKDKRSIISASMAWNYCSANLSSELLEDFAKRLPTPKTGILKTELASRNVAALRTSFMVHMKNTYGYLEGDYLATL